MDSYFKMPCWVYDYNLKPVDREVFMFLINKEFFSQEKLANILKVDVRTIQKSYEKLIELDLIRVEKTIGNQNKYSVTKGEI